MGTTREGLEIRRAGAGDAVDVAAIYAPVVRDTAISFEIEPPSSAEMARRISAAGDALPWLVCRQGEALLGYAYAAAHHTRAAYRWSVDASVYVAEGARRRGVGAGLYETLFGLLELQGLHRVYAGITLPNAASVTLHERMGFTALAVYREVGFKQGAWHDVGWWERPLRPGRGVPAEPAALTSLAPESVAAWLRSGAARVRPA